MNVMRTTLVSAVWLSVCLTPCFGQEAAPPTCTQIYQVKHTDATSLAIAVKQVEKVVHIASDGGTRLILQGPETDVNRVMSTLITPLDTPATPVSGEAPAAVIRLPQAPNDHFMSLVEAFAPSQADTRIGFDSRNRVLVVRGPKAYIDSVKQLVAELNKPMRPLTVTCYFLRGNISAAGSSGGKLPEQLKPIAATLQRTGLGNVSLLAPMILNANDSERFNSSSGLHTNAPEAVDHILRFEVAGTATVTEDDQVELMIEGRVEVPNRSGKTKQGTWFDVNTTIATKLGSYAVIAAAPSTTPDGDFVALVARVDRTD